MCENEQCTTWDARSRATLLHEYAHAWIEENLDEDGQSAFLELVGLPRWRTNRTHPTNEGWNGPLTPSCSG
jgi:hypothetical protein